MKTIQEKRRIITMQYAFESLIEAYTACTKESDKYYVKLQVLSALEDLKCSIRECLEYLKLQEDKFIPFIKLLLDIQETTNTDNEELSDTIEENVPVVVKLTIPKR